MEYYERIKNLRIDTDHSQKQIADILKTGQSYYAKYENGHRPLPIDRLREYSKKDRQRSSKQI